MIRWCKTHELQALPTADKIEVCAGVWREGDCSIVDAVVLSRQPCNNCDGTGTASQAPIQTHQPSEIAKQAAVEERAEMQRAPALFPCPSCSGSGTTWPRDALRLIDNCAESDCTHDHQRAVLILDALVVQEGTTNG